MRPLLASSQPTPVALVSAELLVQLSEALPHVVFIANGQSGGLEHVSHRFTELTGQELGEALGQGYRRFVHPEDLPVLEAAARSALRSGALLTEVRLRDGEGVHRWHEVRARPMRWRSRTRRWFGTCTDVDDQRRARLTQRAVSDVALAIAGTTASSDVLRIFADAVVTSLADVCAIDLAEPGMRARRAAVAIASELGPLPPELSTADPNAPLEEQAPRTLDLARPPRGLLEPLQLTSAAVAPITVAGRCVGHVAIGTTSRATPFHDRDRPLLDDLLRRLTGALTSARLLEIRHETALVRDELLAIVSHELRTPLSTILGWARLLRADTNDVARRERGLEVIERSAVTQGRIIDDLLDVSRAMSGKLRLDPHDVSLVALAHDAAAAMRVSVAEKGLRLDVVAEGTTVVRVDPERIRQVVWNLLANAVKFTPRGGRITLGVTSSPGIARIDVLDSGIGLDPSFLPYVFDRFRQADSSWTRSQGGLGLGLALVRAIVEQHGGRVRAESEGLGRGCRMVVELPERTSVAPPAVVPNRTEASVASTDLLGVRVLVVDDDADARDLCALILGMHGARVTTAENAADAMTRLASEDIEIMVSDIGMPLEDGCSLAARAVERHPGLRCIALSAYARREDGERALAAGFLRHLTKPVDPSFLIDTVREIARAS